MVKVVTLKALQDNFIHLVIQDNKAIIIDPSEALPVIEFLASEKLEPVAILNTHHHHDHVGGNEELKNKFKLEIYCSLIDQSRVPGEPRGLTADRVLKLINFNIHVLHVPGHTKGQINFYFNNQNWLFTGDTLFVSGCGRIFEGSYEELHQSLKKISNLPDKTKIYCGHEYSIKNTRYALSFNPSHVALKDKYEKALLANGLGETTLEWEKRTNPFLMCQTAEGRKILGFDNHHDDLEAFIILRKKRDIF